MSEKIHKYTVIGLAIFVTVAWFASHWGVVLGVLIWAYSSWPMPAAVIIGVALVFVSMGLGIYQQYAEEKNDYRSAGK